jgi:outer membrane protein OmpA-like peptidoglycan-associated protein
MQVVERDGERVLEVAQASVFRVPLPKTLEQDFTLEFQIKIPAGNFITNVTFSPQTTSIARHPGHYISIFHSPGIFKSGTAVSNMQVRSIVESMVPVKMQVDGDYGILYVGAERVANVPVTQIERSGAIEFHITANANYRVYIKDIVVAVGVDKMYEALTATGAFTTRGILFEVDSDAILGPSTPTLDDVYTTLSEHPDLSLIVEGHTDSTGTAEHNNDLSERRAKAVVAYLTGRGIAAGRLSAIGKGEGEPVDDNATPAGRAGNRRVVFKKTG